MKIKRYSWQICFSRYVIIAGSPKWISEWGAVEYRKVFIVDAMGELQEKILNSKKKKLRKKSRVMSPTTPSPDFAGPVLLYTIWN